MNKQRENFKFFVPFEIEKAKDKEGKEVMKISGIASTADRDSDNEVLDPSGFDLSYFMSNGFINWHHQAKDKPEAIIGEPTKAEIRPEGLYVEGLLYPESKLAKQVYELAKGLETSSTKRRLGFSIEGKVIERDTLDERHVKKAKITGLAITPTPKNHTTFLDIIKGNFNEFDNDEIEITPESIANGGTQHIIDITRPNGDRVTVDANYNIKVLTKSTTTENSGKLSPASVDEKLKDLQNNSNNIENNLSKTKKLPKFTALNKSLLFDEILKATGDFEISKQVVNKINLNKMSKKNVSLEDLQKALSDIGVEMDTTTLSKAVKSEDSDEDDMDKKDKKSKFPIKNSEPDENEEEEDNEDEDGEDDVEKAIKSKEAELALMKSEAAKKKAMKKAKADEDAEGDDKGGKKPKASQAEIEEEVNKKMGTMEKGLNAEIGKVSETMEKGISDLTSMFKSFAEKMDERLSNVENQSTGRKSMTSARVIEKAFGDGDAKNNEGKTKLSVSHHRQQISNVLLSKSGIEKGEFNQFYGDAMQSFEATGTLSKAVITDLYTNSNILITE